MAIPSSRSLIFEVKSTGSELAFGRLRTSSGIFGNDRVVFKNPSTPRIKISRLYLRKSWQVYNWTVHAIMRVLKWLFFSLLAKTNLGISCVLILKRALYITNFVNVMINW